MMVKLRHSFILIFLLYSFIDSKFYIYEWADEFDDVWPPAGAELHKKSGYNHVIQLILIFVFNLALIKRVLRHFGTTVELESFWTRKQDFSKRGNSLCTRM